MGKEKDKKKKKKVAPTNFVILIGGPGTFEPCDREHDQTWSNYIVPIQVATQEAQLGLSTGEQAHWWVYAPAYRERWTDDVADVKDKKLDSHKNLLESRQKAIDRVTGSGARDYLDRIEKFAGTVKAKFKAIESPSDFWTELGKLPPGSVSRVWYIGHAKPRALMLKLIHADVDGRACTPAASPSDIITVEDVIAHSVVLTAALAKQGKTSKFYGCNTEGFAQEWNKVFGAAAEGATSKIDFSLIDKPSTIDEVLPRLQDKAGWKSYPAP